MTQTRWLRCLVGKGMFRDERAVTYPTEGEDRKSVLVLRDQVQGEGREGRVRVVVIDENGRTFAELPTPDHDVVLVAPDDLE